MSSLEVEGGRREEKSKNHPGSNTCEPQLGPALCPTSPARTPRHHSQDFSPGTLQQSVTHSLAPALSSHRDLSELGVPRASPRTPNLHTQSHRERGAASERGSTRGKPGVVDPGNCASSGWRGSRDGNRGQRTPRPQAHPAPAPRHPPAALAPAPDSCTDMKWGPSSPKKPAPANQRHAPPSLRLPLAKPSTPAGFRD